MIIPHHEHSAPLLFAHFKADASAYYRLAVPAAAIRRAVVAPAYTMRQSQVANAETLVVCRFGAREDSDHTALRAIVRALKRDAGRLVVDFDDDHWSQPPGIRPAPRTLEASAIVAREADAITTTNSTLAGRLRRLNRDVRVVPNYVRPEDWPEPGPRPDGPPVVVLAGSFTHAEDWRVAAPALRRLLSEKRIALRVCGFLPDYLRDLYVAGQIDYRPWSSLDAYPAMLAGATLGLCPLPDTSFNRCKSPIKLFEYALSGAVVVASPCQYGPVLRAAGLGAFVVPDRIDWYQAICLALETAEQVAPVLRAHVVTHHSAARYAADIHAAYAA